MSEKRLKIVLVGSPAVGKTSIANRYTRNLFANRYIFTVGCDFYLKNVELDDIKYKLIIFDIGGQVEFQAPRRKYMENADIIFIVFALNDPDSHDIEPFFTDIKEIYNTSEEMPDFCIVANKLDLVDLDALDLSKIKSLAESEGSRIYYTSAKENVNVKDLFLEMVKNRAKRATSPSNPS
ncbi:MAG: GTP-binding protein [Candidatus Hodarchaeota archaeon]